MLTSEEASIFIRHRAEKPARGWMDPMKESDWSQLSTSALTLHRS